MKLKVASFFSICCFSPLLSPPVLQFSLLFPCGVYERFLLLYILIERRSKQIHYGNEFGQRQMQHFQPQPQGQSFTFQSSTVTYGGANGAYYTSSRTRRTGSDGVCKSFRL